MGEEILVDEREFSEELDVSHPVLLAVIEIFGVSIMVQHTYTTSWTFPERMIEMFEAVASDGCGNTLYFFDSDRNMYIDVLFASCVSAENAENNLAEALLCGPSLRSDARTVEIPEFRTISELRMKVNLRGGHHGGRISSIDELKLKFNGNA